RGLKTMPDYQTAYWLLVSCEAPPSGRIVDGVADMQVPLDKDGNYTIVVSRPEDRPAALSLCAFARADDNFGAPNGPLPGDVALYQKEQACAEALKTPGYFQSINAAELADAQRSGTYPCATFAGSFDGSNQVYAWRSLDSYQAVSFINSRKPDELYL